MIYDELSRLAKDNTPFLFYTDFKGQNVHVFRLDKLQNHDIEFAFCEKPLHTGRKVSLKKFPLPFAAYKQKFDKIIEKIKNGETYLLNLTQPTPIETDLTLKEIFEQAHASFKLRVKNEFVCFSPERFVRIEDGRITTYPMKGTINAAAPNAEAKLLANPKEMAEHIMIVDLLRNDLGIVAKNIKVEKFRYIDRIKAGDKELLQVSSEISGNLGTRWREELGETIKALLPAGSISGTPKRSTVEIIEEVEAYERGYFTGVFGIYDGKIFDSAVIIRYIENHNGTLVYKSGGGITLESNAASEYQEMLDKIYIA